MTTRQLSDAEYAALKKKLHHAHDKLWKLTLQNLEAMQEYLIKVVMPFLVGII